MYNYVHGILTQQEIERDNSSAEVRFHAMLEKWVKRPSPPPSWSTLVRALENPVINRTDIAEQVKQEHPVS